MQNKNIRNAQSRNLHQCSPDKCWTDKVSPRVEAKPNPRLLLLLLLAFAGACKEQKPEFVEVTEMFPDQKWALPMENLKPLDGSPGLTAKDCSTCHADHYQEWSKSTHAHALSDLQFQSELAKPSSPEWLCLNCHIPVGNQRESIVRKLRQGDLLQPVEEPNPEFDPAMMEEGVTCATCHLQERDGRTVVIGPLGTGKAPHPVVRDRKALQNRCQDCHNVNYKVSSSLVCFFNTGNELKSSELSHKACSDCHMPEVQRSIVSLGSDYPSRLSHMHYFIGGGIPKEFALMPYQEKGGYRSGLGLELVDHSWDAKRQVLTFSVEMRNLDTGHFLPTGDPERFIRITLSIPGATGAPEKSYRLGQHWEWEPEARQIQDNRLKSGEIRIWQDEIRLARKPHRIKLEAVHVRLNEKNANYMEKTAFRVPPPYREKVKNLRKHYPTSRILYSEDILLPIPGSDL